MKTNANIINQMAVDQAVILNKVGNVEKRLDSIDNKLEAQYVTQDQFEPVKKLVYGVVGIILTGVVVAMVALVINK